MRSISEIGVYSNSKILNKLKSNRFNILFCQGRNLGLTTLLIKHINQINHNENVLFLVKNTHLGRRIRDEITHPNCEIRPQNYTPIGRNFYHIVHDNFFEGQWLNDLVRIGPAHIPGGSITLGCDRFPNEAEMYFNQYNKIIKKR